MNKRPLAVTIIAWLLICTGTLGLVYHLSELKHGFRSDVVSISLVRILAIVAGVFLLRGESWARWLAVAWMGFHVAISFYHSISQVLMHALFLILIAYFLFRPAASRYFHPPEIKI